MGDCVERKTGEKKWQKGIFKAREEMSTSTTRTGRNSN